MKIFQIKDGFVISDFSKYGKTKKDIPTNLFPKELMDELVEAPDEVRIGWGYDRNTETWIPAVIEEGYAIDPESGTIYPDSLEIRAQILFQNHSELYTAVITGYLTEEHFEEITGEQFLRIE